MVHQRSDKNFVNDGDDDADYDFAIRYLLFSEEFIITLRFTSGWMKIFTAETQRSQRFSFFLCVLCALCGYF